MRKCCFPCGLRKDACKLFVSRTSRTTCAGSWKRISTVYCKSRPQQSRTATSFLRSTDGIHQRSDPVNCNPNFIALLQRERIRGNDSRTGEEKTSIGKDIVAIEILNQRGEIALHAGERRRSSECALPSSQNLQTNFG